MERDPRPLVGGRLAGLVKSADQDRRATAAMVDALLEDSKKLLMFPFPTLLELFPKLVRDLSRDQGKEVDLVLRGGEVEMDKRILEEMKDPLIHLLRNAVDHGIEAPERGRRRASRARGTIPLGVSQVDGSKVEIRRGRRRGGDRRGAVRGGGRPAAAGVGGRGRRLGDAGGRA